MTNSGYGSVGHILATKCPQDYCKSMRHFCTVIFCNLDESKIHKESGYWIFDQFFRGIDMTVDSFSKFVSGILRKRDTSEFELQILIEKLVWDMIKNDFDPYVTEKLDRKLALFRLYCIFTRFCNQDVIPMELPEKNFFFIMREVGISVKDIEVQRPITIHNFFRSVQHFEKNVNVKQVKKMYDEYVRNILKEGRVRYHILGKTPKAPSKSLKTVAVTSENLVIYDDDGNLDQPQKVEPSGKVLHKIPLMDAETYIVRSILKRNQVILRLTSNKAPVLEMLFNESKDNYDLYSWSQAVQESSFSLKANTNRLQKVCTRLDFLKGPKSPEPLDDNKERRASEPTTPTLDQLDHMGRSSSSHQLFHFNMSTAGDEDSDQNTEPERRPKAPGGPANSPSSVEAEKKRKRFSNLPSAFHKIVSRSSSSYDFNSIDRKNSSGNLSELEDSEDSSSSYGSNVILKSRHSLFREGTNDSLISRSESCTILSRTF